MFLENLVFDAREPNVLGRFWEMVVGGETLSDDVGGFETRLSIKDGPVLDLCFQPVSDTAAASPRLHLDVAAGPGRDEVVERMLALGARHLDIGQGDVPWVVLADPEGNPCCVLEQRAAYDSSGPIAAVRLDSADPDRDADFWSWLSGWVDVPGAGAPRSLQHASFRGPLLELFPETSPKGDTKNWMHLDVRLEAGEDADAVEALVLDRGASPLLAGWGELPWRSYRDPSGNEFCVLPAPKT